MTTAAPAISPLSSRPHRFTVDQYHLMAQTGVLTHQDRVELLNGEIVDMTPIGSEHSGHVNKLLIFLRSIDPSEAILSIQNPILLSDHSEPQPDLAVLRPRPDSYAKSLPGPNDILFLIEVADTSLDTDRRIKIPLYAQAGIPETWLINLPGKCLELFRNPVNGRYQQTQTLKPPATITPLAFPNCALNLAPLFAD